MNPRARIFSSPIFVLAVIFAALALLSLPVLIAHPILDYDDFFLLDQLRPLHGLTGYAKAWSHGQIVDLAPLRDITYLFEFKLQRLTRFENHQLTNLLFWFATIAAFYFCLRRLVQPPIAAAAAFLVAIHPVMTQSVYWVSGRKHILSALFVMLGLNFFFKALSEKRSTNFMLVFFFYVLSLLAWPINIGLPIFFAFYLRQTGELKTNANKSYAFLSSLFVAAVISAYANIKYYSGESYTGSSGGALRSKFISEKFGDWVLLGKRFLIWGRDAFQLLLPLKPSVASYKLIYWPSFVGLIAILALAIFALRFRSRIKWQWVLFICLPISVVTFRLTNVGGIDCYILTPLLGCGFLLATSVAEKPIKMSMMKFGRNAKAVLFVALILLICSLDFKMSNVWSDEENVWEYANEAEGSQIARLAYAKQLLSDPEPDINKVWSLAERAYADAPTSPELGYILGKCIYLRAISVDEKRGLFSKYDLASPWFFYFWSAFEAQSGRFVEAEEKLEKIYVKDPKSFLRTFQFNPEVEEKWLKICEQAGREDCARIHGYFMNVD